MGANWQLIFKEPPAGYQLIVPDLRGHGRSTNSSPQFSFRQSALDVFALLDQLGVHRFKAAGMSMGAKTLLHIHGDRDPLYPVNLALEMFAAIQSSYLWIVQNGGHGPIFGNYAAPFVATALTFFNREWQS